MVRQRPNAVALPSRHRSARHTFTVDADHAARQRLVCAMSTVTFRQMPADGRADQFERCAGRHDASDARAATSPLFSRYPTGSAQVAWLMIRGLRPPRRARSLAWRQSTRRSCRRNRYGWAGRFRRARLWATRGGGGGGCPWSWRLVLDRLSFGALSLEVLSLKMSRIHARSPSDGVVLAHIARRCRHIGPAAQAFADIRSICLQAKAAQGGGVKMRRFRRPSALLWNPARTLRWWPGVVSKVPGRDCLTPIIGERSLRARSSSRGH